MLFSRIKPLYPLKRQLQLLMWHHICVNVFTLNIFLFMYLLAYLFVLVVLGLCGGAQAFSSCEGCPSLQCMGFSWGHLLLWSMGCRTCRLQYLRYMGSVVVAHRLGRLSCSMANGIFPDQELNPCLLYWQVDSLPLSHQGSPKPVIKLKKTGFFSLGSFRYFNM